MSKLYRRRAFPNGVKLDELVAKNSDATLENGKPVIYNGPRDALETTDKVDIDTLTADTIVTEDLYVNGKMVVDDVETIESVGDNIVLRANNTSGLATGETSGIIVNHYNTNGDLLAIQTDSTGTVRLATGIPVQTTYVNIYYGLSDNKWYSDPELTTEVAVEGVLTSWDSVDITDDYKHYTHAIFSSTNFNNAEAILTRDEETNLNDQGLLVWDADDTEAKTLPLPTNDEDELVPTFVPDDPSVPEVGKWTYSWQAKKAGVYTFATMADYETYAASHNIPDGSRIIIENEDTIVKSKEWPDHA